jgi:isoleucyl-tRNA synthetase
LAKLLIKEGALSFRDHKGALQIIKDEVNVKEITFDKNLNSDVELDLNITPELKEEGMVRELIRVVQDLRKDKGLTVNDKAVLIVETDKNGEEFIKRNEKNLSAVTSLSSISYSKVEGEAVKVGDFDFKVSIK